MRVFFTELLTMIVLFPLGAQTPVTVADLTLKIGAKSEEVLHYGFAAGDEVLLSVSVEDEKTLKEVLVTEYPASLRYRDYELGSVREKAIPIQQNSILEFRFLNNDLLKGRVCRVLIQRIPAGLDSRTYNTAVKWVEIFDTTWVMVAKEIDHGGEEWQEEMTRKVLTSVDTTVVQVLNRTERVHSRTKVQGSSISEVCFELPANRYTPDHKDPDRATEVVSWAYTITVGQAGKQWFNEANVKAGAKTVASAAVKLGTISSGYGALAMLAIEGVSLFTTPPSGDNIWYETYTVAGEERKVLDAGNSVASSKRITGHLQGRYCIELRNDNIVDGINVDLAVIAVLVVKNYADETYFVTKTGPRREKVMVREARVEVKRIPVQAQ